jgi:protoporphyrinogen oxidase
MGHSPGRKPRVVITGAGSTRLAAAYEPARAGCDSTVLERNRRVGGPARTFDQSTAALEKLYHHGFANDVDAIGLVRESGLESGLLSRKSRAAMVYQGQFSRLSRPTDVLRLGALCPFDRLRLACLCRRAKDIAQDRIFREADR